MRGSTQVLVVPLRAALARLLVVLAVGAGCADADSAPIETAVPRWTSQVELRIGSVDDPATALTAVGTILAHPDGRFYVSQPQDARIRIHAPDGKLLGTFGGSGEGPGEFARIGSMGWLGSATDTIWVSDVQLRRVTFFLADGTFVRSVQLTNPPYREFLRPAVVSVPADGTALGMAAFPSRMLATGEITSIPVLRIELAGGPATSVVETDPRNQQLSVACGTAMSYSSQPYADAPLISFGGPGGRVAVVERRAAIEPAQARLRVTLLEAAGDTVWSRAYRYEPVALPSAESDSVLNARVERAPRRATPEH